MTHHDTPPEYVVISETLEELLVIGLERERMEQAKIQTIPETAKPISFNADEIHSSADRTITTHLNTNKSMTWVDEVSRFTDPGKHKTKFYQYNWEK
jgi:acyl-[acyl carrier protein]--UDP-N-acetylglucosamine O-acyltransferase